MVPFVRGGKSSVIPAYDSVLAGQALGVLRYQVVYVLFTLSLCHAWTTAGRLDCQGAASIRMVNIPAATPRASRKPAVASLFRCGDPPPTSSQRSILSSSLPPALKARPQRLLSAFSAPSHRLPGLFGLANPLLTSSFGLNSASILSALISSGSLASSFRAIGRPQSFSASTVTAFLVAA